MVFKIETECGHCQEPIWIEINGELEYEVLEKAAKPMVYVPMVDVQNIEAPSIIDDF